MLTYPGFKLKPKYKMIKNIGVFSLILACLYAPWSLAEDVQIVHVPSKNTQQQNISNPASHGFGIGNTKISDSSNYIENNSSCFLSFKETRERMLDTNTQSVILLSHAQGIAPFITLQSKNENKDHYVLWQSLNGDIRGYALRNDKGFDYANNIVTPLPLSWHPTLIWDRLFGSKIPLKQYSCVLTGRTRVMGRKVSLLRLVPQDGLRYTYLIAKEDESDFPVELSIIDPKGIVISRLTTMDSRIIAGSDFPISDEVFDRILELKLEEKRQAETLSQNTIIANNKVKPNNIIMANKDNTLSKLVEDENQDILSESKTLDDSSLYGDISNEHEESALQLVLPKPTKSAGVTANHEDNKLNVDSLNQAINSSKVKKLKIWPELNVPKVYTLVDEGQFYQGGENCFFQEFSDGLTSFRVYKNVKTTINYPFFNNGSLTILRKNNVYHEYSVVGEVPLALAEFILAHINDF